MDCVVDCDGVLNLGNCEMNGIVIYHRRSHLIGPVCRVSTSVFSTDEQDVQQSRRRPLRPSAQCASRSTPFHWVEACTSRLSLTQKRSGSPKDQAGRIEVPCRTNLRRGNVVCDSKDVVVRIVAPLSFTGHASGMLRAQTPLSPNLGLFDFLLYLHKVQPSDHTSI